MSESPKSSRDILAIKDSFAPKKSRRTNNPFCEFFRIPAKIFVMLPAKAAAALVFALLALGIGIFIFMMHQDHQLRPIPLQEDQNPSAASFETFAETTIPEDVFCDRIVVQKSSRKMTLHRGSEALKSYRIALGGNPVGHKEVEGDQKTPEGIYRISGRNPNSRFHLSLRISYPNAADILHAQTLGLSPGGDIMIHGLPNGFSGHGSTHNLIDWTAGCLAVTNEEIEEIWRVTPDETVVEIRP